MCNLYSITTNQAAILALFRVVNRCVGNLPPMPGVSPRCAFLELLRTTFTYPETGPQSNLWLDYSQESGKLAPRLNIEEAR
jgi:hypothetical protein